MWDFFYKIYYLKVFYEKNLILWNVFTNLQISEAQNRVYLNAGTLMLNINDEGYEAGLKSIKKATTEKKEGEDNSCWCSSTSCESPQRSDRDV